MARCQLSPETARALLRHATTLQRLAEAQCNGDWPADNGERKVKPCPLCEQQWVPSAIQGGPMARAAWKAKVPAGPTCAENQGKRACNGGTEPCDHLAADLRKACPDCRTEARVRALLEGTQWQAWTQGDPRGYVLRLFPRRVPGCTGCAGKANRGGGTVYHQSGCGGPSEGNTMVDVTPDDMHYGRVDGLGVPTR